MANYNTREQNLANLTNELSIYILEGNDYMADKIQTMIDNLMKTNTNETLNEVVDTKTLGNLCD